jgi:hypothetical protein
MSAGAASGAAVSYLVYGGKTGWIGQKVLAMLLAQGITARAAEARLEKVEQVAAELDAVLEQGSAWVVRQRGMGTEEDLAHTESGGQLPAARAGAVSARARERGRDQLGTLGGGNHFL